MKFLKAVTLITLTVKDAHSFSTLNRGLMNNVGVNLSSSNHVLFSSATDSEDKSAATEPKAARHDVRSAGAEGMQIDEEELKIQQALQEHQSNAPKLGWATDIRTLVQYNHGFAVMSTNSKS